MVSTLCLFSLYRVQGKDTQTLGVSGTLHVATLGTSRKMTALSMQGRETSINNPKGPLKTSISSASLAQFP